MAAGLKQFMTTEGHLRWILLAFVLGMLCYFYYESYEHDNRRSKKYNDMIHNVIDGREGFVNWKVGGNSYKIHEDLTDPGKAAETMDKLNGVAKQLIDHLYSKYIESSSGSDFINPQYQDVVLTGIKALKKNFRSAAMEENIPERSGGDTSYVIDKGDVFAMCLRDPKNGNQIDPNFNALTFVLIHEMSHLANASYGHPPEFWSMFKFILQEAANIGLYEIEDYKKNGSPYCGIVITYSPIFDAKLDEYRKM